jgi:hypothetical protein
MFRMPVLQWESFLGWIIINWLQNMEQHHDILPCSSVTQQVLTFCEPLFAVVIQVFLFVVVHVCVEPVTVAAQSNARMDSTAQTPGSRVRISLEAWASACVYCLWCPMCRQRPCDGLMSRSRSVCTIKKLKTRQRTNKTDVETIIKKK